MAEPTETVRLTIDGIPVTVPKGTLVIEAARRVGVMIPHFCYHPKLKPDANCRMCLVEVEKMPKLQTSCSTVAADGMAVRTATTVVNDAHKSVLEFILANHPLDCPVCDQGGRCDLQDFSHQYTATGSRFAETKRIFQKEYFSPLIETQMNRCVQCLRCVRYCDEIMDVKALAPVGRGTMTEIKSFGPHPLDCEFCGGCVQICPVGAITSRLSMYEYRPWMLKRADTICGYCGDGCQITVQTKGNQLIEVNSAHGAGRNNGDLCARGFFGFHASSEPSRLTKPMIRRAGRLVEATWEEALEFTASELARIKSANGAQAIGGLISSRCTNEELYLFQKFMRLAIGTNHLDSSARYGQINGIQALRRVQGTHRWTVTFEDLAAADTLLLVGTHVTEANPITGLRVKEAVKKREASLFTIDSMQPAIGTISNIANLSREHLCLTPDRFNGAILGLLKAVVDNGLVAPEVRRQAPDFVDAVTTALGALTWDQLAAEGATRAPLTAMAQGLSGGRRVVILAGQELLRSRDGYRACINLLDLLLLLGKLTNQGCGLAPLAEENNDQGAVEMGALADLLPGAKDLSDDEARTKLERTWKGSLPTEAGATLTGMIEQAANGAIKSLIVVGENPVGTLPARLKVAEAFQRLEFLVCQELFLTETASLAHVVLPVASSLEKAGTFTNTEGHVQAVRPAVDPAGESRPDWEILSALSVLLDVPMDYTDQKDLLKEIRSVIPGYGSLGPAPTPPKVDQGGAMDRYLTGGYRRDQTARYTLAPRTKQADGTWQLQLVQSLFHSGKLSVRSKGLIQIEAGGAARLNPLDGTRLGVKDGDRITLSNDGGQVSATVKLAERVPPGSIWYSDSFSQDVGRLLECAVAPDTQSPSFRTANVSVAKTA